MGFEWPEEEPGRRPPRRAGGPLRGGPLQSTDLFEVAAPDAAHGRYWLVKPALVFVLVVLALGLVLALAGPLPTVFPKLDCGYCAPLVR